MSAKSQSIISSRIHTNNVFKAEETKKNNELKRDSNPIDILNKNKYEIVGTKIEEISNKENKKRNSDQMESDKTSFNFDDKVLKTSLSSLFITLNRLMYSKNCVKFYFILIILSIFVLVYSIYGYFAKLSIYF